MKGLIRQAAVIGGLTALVFGATAASSAPVDEGPAGYRAVTPVRLVDTRAGLGGVTLGAGATLVVPIASTAQVPDDATAVVFNLTAVDGTASSFLSVWPTGEDRPLASSINWNDGGATANEVTTKLGKDKSVSIYNQNGSVDVIVDLAGYYRPIDDADLGAIGIYGGDGSRVGRMLSAGQDGIVVMDDQGYVYSMDFYTGAFQALPAQEVFTTTDCTGPSMWSSAMFGVPTIRQLLFTKAATDGNEVFRPGEINLAFDVTSYIDHNGDCQQDSDPPVAAMEAISYGARPANVALPISIEG